MSETTRRRKKIETGTEGMDCAYNYFAKAPTPENFAMLLCNMKEYQECWIIDRIEA